MNFIGTWMLRFAFSCGLIAFLLIVFKKDNEKSKDLGVLTGIVSCIGVLSSSLFLFFSLVSGNYSVEYVYHNTEKSLPLIYKISAFWSGSSGSMLLWTSVFAVLLIIVYFKNLDKRSTKTIYGVILFVMTLFMFVVTFIKNPFNHVSQQTDGFGLNPALQSIGMVFHPPVVIIAFSFFFIAFGYQLFDLRNNIEENEHFAWKWAMRGWILLTAGIVMGGIWAYTELGWGGYWGWDTIENSSLVNWLFATTFLHGLSRKGNGNNRKRMNFILIFLTVFTMLIGTYFARSGLLKSVHAYSSQGVKIVFGVVLLALLLSFMFFYFRIKRLYKEGVNKPKEAGLNIRNILLKLKRPQSIFTTLSIIIAVLIFGGTIYPLFGGIFSKNASITPTSFYEYAFGIFGILMLLILAICPKFSSGKGLLLIPGAACGLAVLILMVLLSDYGFLTKLSIAVCAMLAVNLVIEIVINYKKILTNPGFMAFLILHAALIILTVGFAGSRGMLLSTHKTLEKGSTMTIGKYEVKYRNLYWKEEPGKTTAVAVIGVRGPKGKLQLKPELSYYQKMKTSHSRAVIKSGLKEDLYIIFEGIDENDNITLKVMVLQWVSLVWIGSILLIIGALLHYVLKKRTRLIQN
ncbi:MAG TPA: cytochrome c biogenesis protein CcsA [Clostridia bacterium]|nr:cytochrome c biogenesis protein CcsA [Clostridia bacterium]